MQSAFVVHKFSEWNKLQRTSMSYTHVTLKCDNTSIISILKNLAKYIEIRHDFLDIMHKKMATEFVSTIRWYIC